jgi:hypothetical protein
MGNPRRGNSMVNQRKRNIHRKSREGDNIHEMGLIALYTGDQEKWTTYMGNPGKGDNRHEKQGERGNTY